MPDHALPPAPQKANCPTCGAPASTRPRLHPFCSLRCADVDLGRWFGGHYRIPGLPPDLEDDEPPRT